MHRQCIQEEGRSADHRKCGDIQDITKRSFAGKARREIVCGAEFVEAPSKHSRPTPLEIVEHYKFYSCVRKAGESIPTFVAELRPLSESAIQCLEIQMSLGIPLGMVAGPLFILSLGVPLMRTILVSKLMVALETLEVDESLYNGHSFHIGAATTAAQQGLQDSLIQTLRRWRSEAFEIYIKLPWEQLATVSRTLVRGC